MHLDGRRRLQHLSLARNPRRSPSATFQLAPVCDPGNLAIRHGRPRDGRAWPGTGGMDSTDESKTNPAAVERADRPTLKTIAYITGLGVTTVSRALNDAPDIGQATKERVRLVAKQIGYRPN